MPREARSSARTGPTPFRYFTSEASVNGESGIASPLYPVEAQKA